MTSEPKSDEKKSSISIFWIIFDLALLLLVGFILLSLFPNGPQKVKDMVASRQATSELAEAETRIQISLPRSAFADEGAFLKAGSRINLISVGDVVATTEADVIDIGEKAVLLELPPAVAETFMTDETLVLKYTLVIPTPDLTSTPTPTPTPLGVQISLPLSAFADGGAFLKAGGLVSLVGIAGGTVQVTTAARVVELRDGTRPAVMIDVPTKQAPAVQAYMAAGTPIFQTIAIPPAPTPDD